MNIESHFKIGNTFTFMFAGHGECVATVFTFVYPFSGSETTAHVLAATLALLAFHQEEQEKVLSEIRGVVPDNKDPVSILNLSDTFQFEIGLCHRTMTMFLR